MSLAPFFLAILLQGCSVTRVAYDNADTFLRWQVNGYFDFEGEQGDRLDARIDAFLAWHRRQALPQYARFTEEAATRMLRGMKRADLDWGYDALRVQVRESLEAAAGGMAELLDQLSAEQIAHLERRIADENRKFSREQLQGTVEERRKRRFRRSLDRLEDWFGTLSDAQSDRVRAYAERAPFAAELRDRDRKRRQAELLAMLRAREAKKRLVPWTLAWETDREPAYAAVARADRAAYYDLLIDLDATLTQAQREHAVHRLRDWGEIFGSLSRR